MKKAFTVFSSDPQQIERDVKDSDGNTHRVPVPGHKVQLVPVNQDGTGTISLAVPVTDGADIEVGATMEIDFDFPVKVKEAEASA